jgi:hypothetical protein
VHNLVIIIDGLGYDQIARFRPDGLIGRGERNGLVPLTTLLTYSSGIYPSIWSGQYPDEHDVWTEFYRCERPQFALTAPLGLLPGKYLPRKLSYLALGALRRLGVERAEYFGVPPQLQAQFGRAQSRYMLLPPVDMPDAPLISRVIEQRGQTWEYVFCHDLDSGAERRIKTAAERVDTLIVCFASMDEAGHHYGPLSDAFGVQLRAFDARLSRLLADLERASPGVATFLFSDHGMTAVTGQFDAWSYLEARGFRLGRDYTAFINSTLISLWFDSGNREAIVAALNQCGRGRVLSAAERARYHLNFRDRRYGDDFFLVDEGVELIPNFISLAWRGNLGMHGYDPDCSSTRSFFIGGAQVDARPRDVVGLYDVLVEMTMAIDCVI